jgi:hypothetical protein
MPSNNSNNSLYMTQTNDTCLLLASVDKELKEYFSNYLLDEYKGDNSERLDYVDISEIARFILTKYKDNQVDKLKIIFDQVENILTNCDDKTENLIVVGLFEGIQNSCGTEIDYHFQFDNFLKPISKFKWDRLIDSWEGEEWRMKK